MATATHYDAFDFLEHVVNRALQPRTHAACAPRSNAQDPNATAHPATNGAAAATRQPTRLIRMNVSETAAAYLVVAELPGVKKGDVEVVIDGKDVSLQAESKRPETQPASVEAQGTETPVAERLLMDERFYGKLTRRIQLPQEIDDTAAQARFVDGILYLQLPKKKVPGVRKLDIQ